MTQKKLSLCPECCCCPEIELITHEDGRKEARLVEGEQVFSLPDKAWNELVRLIQKGELSAL